MANDIAKELENYNPMVEHYEDPESNVYGEDQPGSNIIPAEGNISRVYLKNYPDTLTLQGVKNLCSDYGTVISVHKPPNSVKYVFIEFASPAEAQFFIEEVNNKFRKTSMRADFAKSKRDDYVLPPPMPPPMPRSKDSHETFINPRRFKLQFVKPSFLTLGSIEPEINKEFYDANLSKIDPTGLYFNEITYCDILRFESDDKNQQKCFKNKQLVDFVWTFKPDEKFMEKLGKLSKDLTNDHIEGNQKLVANKGNYQPKSLTKFGHCKICNSRTARINKETGDIFCSISCSEKSLDEVEADIDVSKTILIPGQVNNNCLVKILSVTAQNILYVRQTDTRTTHFFYQTLDQVNAASRNAEPYKTLPNIGDVIAVRIGDNYYRALVLKHLENLEIRVALIDTGAVTIKKLDDCVYLSLKLAKLPIFASKVELKDVPVPYISYDAIDFLTSLLITDAFQELIIKWSGNDGFQAELSLASESINDKLREMIKIKQPKYGKLNIFDSDLPSKIFATEKECELVIMDNSMLPAGALNVLHPRDVNKLRNIHDKVQYYGQSAVKERFTPRHNELCVVDIEGIWYRAICIEVCGDQHPSIMCIDFGFVSIVNIKDILPFPEELLDTCVTQTCKISNFSVSLEGEKLKEAQQELHVSRRIKAEKVSRTNDNQLILHSKEVENILQKYQVEETIPEETVEGKTGEATPQLFQNGIKEKSVKEMEKSLNGVLEKSQNGVLKDSTAVITDQITEKIPVEARKSPLETIDDSSDKPSDDVSEISSEVPEK